MKRCVACGEEREETCYRKRSLQCRPCENTKRSVQRARQRAEPPVLAVEPCAEMSFEEIAAEMGLTSQRIGQIYQSAIAKVAAACGDCRDLREWLRETLTGPESRMHARPTQTRRYS